MESLTLKIRFDDRLGLVLDVTKVLFRFNENIAALQLMNNVMFLEIEASTPDQWPALLGELESVPAILSVERISDMPYQSREKQMEAIINSITPLGTCEDAFAGIVGNSSGLRTAVSLAKQVAPTDSAILLKGESGTGKELFAKAVHLASMRRDKVFVPLNCGAIPENLLESELFGYVDGAFSGAKKGGRVGLFQFASEGTLFFDEITEMPLSLQVKLLRVIQEKKVRPLGSNEEIAVNCRLIAATNLPIEELLRKKLFREDLYYRLNVIPLQIPPLRERKEDIPLLSEHFLTKQQIRSGVIKRFSPQALEKLLCYDWPGNIRELENVVERAWHLSRGMEINASQVCFDGNAGEYPLNVITSEREQVQLKAAKERTEEELIIMALKTYGSIRKAARALGVSHTTVSNKVKKFGLDG